jgi:hypothetical protein
MATRNGTKKETGMTKKVDLSAEFRAAALKDPEGALAHMIIATMGVSLSTVMGEVEKMLAAKDNKALLLCLAAAVQIRENTVFVGNDFAGFRTKYSTLVITSGRAQNDVYNFGAIHACGHALAVIGSGSVLSHISTKAGNCVTGSGFTDNEAGQINAEIYRGWTVEDKAAWPAWLTRIKAAHETKVTTLGQWVPSAAVAFGKLLSPVLHAAELEQPGSAKALAGPPLAGSRPSTKKDSKDAKDQTDPE